MLCPPRGLELLLRQLQAGRGEQGKVLRLLGLQFQPQLLPCCPSSFPSRCQHSFDGTHRTSHLMATARQK